MHLVIVCPAFLCGAKWEWIYNELYTDTHKHRRWFSVSGRHWFESQHHTNSSIYLDRILKTTFLFKQLASGKLIYQFCIFFCIKDFKHFPVLRSWSCRLGTPAVPSLAAAKKHSGLWGLNLLHPNIPPHGSASTQTSRKHATFVPEGPNPRMLTAVPINLSLFSERTHTGRRGVSTPHCKAATTTTCTAF